MSFADEIIKEINFLRTHPKDYADKLLSFEKYFENKIFKFPGQNGILTKEGFDALKEAADKLKSLSPLNSLTIHPLITKISHDIMNEVIEDTTSQTNLGDVIAKHGEFVGPFAQASGFGSPTAELVVVHLISDDGDSSRGNRENLLNKKFKLIGAANGKHKKYNTVSVVCFARHFFGIGEEHGVLSDDCYEKIEKDSENQVSDVTKTTENQQKSYKEDEEKENESKLPNSQPVQNEYDSDDIPEGVLKMEKQEIEKNANGKKYKIIKVTKYMEDGTVIKETFRKDIK